MDGRKQGRQESERESSSPQSHKSILLSRHSQTCPSVGILTLRRHTFQVSRRARLSFFLFLPVPNSPAYLTCTDCYAGTPDSSSQCRTSPGPARPLHDPGKTAPQNTVIDMCTSGGATLHVVKSKEVWRACVDRNDWGPFPHLRDAHPIHLGFPSLNSAVPIN